MLFERTQETPPWEPAKPPQVLGELLDSRYMLPLLFPSDPRMLAALPGKIPLSDDSKRETRQEPNGKWRTTSLASVENRRMTWRSRNRKLREVGIGSLKWVDGVRSAARWGRPQEPDGQTHYASDDSNPSDEELGIITHITPLTRKPSGRSKGRSSLGGGEITPVERS
jgi:hypothetical protein